MMKLPVLLLTFVMHLAATATNADVQGDFEYQANEDGTVAVTRYLGSEGEVVIPAALGGKVVTVIEAWAFGNCENVARVTIPDSVSSLSGWAFEGCGSLVSINVDALNLAYSSSDGVGFTKDQKTLIRFPVVRVGSFTTVPDGVIAIGESMFNDCGNLSGVAILDSVTRIGERVFGGFEAIHTRLNPFQVVESTDSVPCRGRQLADLRSIGVDEIAYCRGHNYVTIVYDLERSCVVWVGKGKTRETIDGFFTEVLTQEQREAIETASCDLGQTYIMAIKRFCPNAVLVLDRFHVVKRLNEAVDEVRKEQWRNASKEYRKFYKGIRWILFRHSSNRSPKDTKTLKSLDRSNRRIYRASQLKDEFDQFWESKDIGEAERHVRKWMTSVRRGRLEPIKEFVKTLENHFSDVLAYIGTPISSAIAEGLNRVIKMVKNRVRGFRKWTRLPIGIS